MTTATASIAIARPAPESVTAEPRSPVSAPSTVKPITRPALNATCGRHRAQVPRPAAPLPVAPSAAAALAEKPSTRPPTSAMQVLNPAARPRSTTTSSEPDVAVLPTRSASVVRPLACRNTASSPTPTTATARSRHTAGSRVSQGRGRGEPSR